jgi:hypothetical protein
MESYPRSVGSINPFTTIRQRWRLEGGLQTATRVCEQFFLPATVESGHAEHGCVTSKGVVLKSMCAKHLQFTSGSLPWGNKAAYTRFLFLDCAQ